MPQEPVTVYVLDVVLRTGAAIRCAAQLGYETLLMAKATYAKEWEERDETQLTMLKDLADGKFVTLRDNDARERQTAEAYLRMYGGSKKNQERGLSMLAQKETKP